MVLTAWLILECGVGTHVLDGAAYLPTGGDDGDVLSAEVVGRGCGARLDLRNEGAEVTEFNLTSFEQELAHTLRSLSEYRIDVALVVLAVVARHVLGELVEADFRTQLEGGTVEGLSGILADDGLTACDGIVHVVVD